VHIAHVQISNLIFNHN